MAVIRIEARLEGSLKSCEGRNEPVLGGSFIEFQDATEEELAFWNVLDDEEKAEVVTLAHYRCFFDVLHDLMQREAEKGKKLEEQEAAFSAVEGPGPAPNSPPTPNSPNQPPPIQQ
jgi:predicted Fe-S protein YdhL (DUF1289 family)